LPKVPEFWCFFSNTKLLIFGNFYFSKKSLNSFSIYLAKGKTIVGKNTRLFERKIQIRQIYFFKYISTGEEGEMDGIVKSQGIIIADYHFREDKKLSATGVFEGKVLLRWYVNNKGVFSYDTINIKL